MELKDNVSIGQFITGSISLIIVIFSGIMMYAFDVAKEIAANKMEIEVVKTEAAVSNKWQDATTVKLDKMLEEIHNVKVIVNNKKDK